MRVPDSKIVRAVASAKTMKEAAVLAGVHFNTLKRRATDLGIYRPTPHREICRLGGKSPSSNKICLKEILRGEHPTYHTWHLNRRIRENKIFDYVCSECKIDGFYNKKPIALELDHINGVRWDHRIENLRYLCPNCHSQTDTYKSKNISKDG